MIIKTLDFRDINKSSRESHYLKTRGGRDVRDVRRDYDERTFSTTLRRVSGAKGFSIQVCTPCSMALRAVSPVEQPVKGFKNYSITQTAQFFPE